MRNHESSNSQATAAKALHQVVTSHRSIRKYTDEQVSDDDLKLMLDAVIHAPTSVNGQQCSVVVVKDPQTKAKLAELTGNQRWVAEAPVFLLFVADFHRVAKALEARGVEFKNIDSIEATLVGAVDCGIAFGSVMNLAEALGYGIVPIGAVRRDPKAIIELLGLPKYVYPIVGMCVGVPAEDPAKKPRFTADAFIHNEKYQPLSDEALSAYDDVVRAYMEQRTAGQDVRDWSGLVSGIYANVYFPKVKPTLASQGFSNTE